MGIMLGGRTLNGQVRPLDPTGHTLGGLILNRCVQLGSRFNLADPYSGRTVHTFTIFLVGLVGYLADQGQLRGKLGDL